MHKTQKCTKQMNIQKSRPSSIWYNLMRNAFIIIIAHKIHIFYMCSVYMRWRTMYCIQYEFYYYILKLYNILFMFVFDVYDENNLFIFIIFTTLTHEWYLSMRVSNLCCLRSLLVQNVTTFLVVYASVILFHLYLACLINIVALVKQNSVIC